MREDMANELKPEEVQALVRRLGSENQGVIAMAISDYVLIRELSARLAERAGIISRVSEAIEKVIE